MNQVANLTSIQDKVKERIQSSFMELLPPEIFENMVKTELDRFVKEDLPRLVREEASRHMLKSIQAHLTSGGWLESWGPQGQVASDLVKQVVKESSEDLVAALFGTLVQGAVNYIRSARY